MGDCLSLKPWQYQIKFRSLTDSNLGSRETEFHHELDQNLCKSFNIDASNVCTYFKQKGNPYIMLESKFYKIACKELFLDIVTQKYLSCYTHGTEQYKVFSKCFVTNLRKFPDTIKNQNSQILKFTLKPTLNRKTIQ